MPLNILNNAQESLQQQRVIYPQMSTVLRLRTALQSWYLLQCYMLPCESPVERLAISFLHALGCLS